MEAEEIKGIGLTLLSITGVREFTLKENKKTGKYKLRLKLINKTYLPIVMEQVWSATKGVIIKKLIFEF